MTMSSNANQGRYHGRYLITHSTGLAIRLIIIINVDCSPVIRALGCKGHLAGEQKTISQSRQTLESIQSDFDRIALLSNEKWNHNLQYHEYLISHKRDMRRIKIILKYLFAISFVLAGFNHFINTAFYLKIMPPFLPWHRPLVYLSGVIEIALGLLLIIRKSARVAAWGLIALLVAVFPANVHMAINQHLYPEYSGAALWLRLPLQIVLIAWAYCYTRQRAAQPTQRDG